MSDDLRPLELLVANSIYLLLEKHKALLNFQKGKDAEVTEKLISTKNEGKSSKRAVRSVAVQVEFFPQESHDSRILIAAQKILVVTGISACIIASDELPRTSPVRVVFRMIPWSTFSNRKGRDVEMT